MSEPILKPSGRTWRVVPWACLALLMLALPLKGLGNSADHGETIEHPPTFHDLITSTTMLKPQPQTPHRFVTGNGEASR